MNRSLITLVSLSVLVFLISGCSTETNKSEKLSPFFVTSSPVKKIGLDGEIEVHGAYQSIWYYQIDNDSNVYISNPTGLNVDKFDYNGKYLFAFGGSAHKTAKFLGWFERFAVDSHQNLFAYSTVKGKLLAFSKNGQKLNVLDVDQRIKKMSVKRIEVDCLDNLYFLGFTKSEGYLLVKLDLKQNISTVIHNDNKRQRPAFKDLLPDLEFDDKNNIFVTDSIDYKVYKYSTDGRLIDVFEKKYEKQRIIKQDFNFFIRPGKIEKIPNYESAWKRLKGDSRYFPAIFGINIDSNRIYLWTSGQDKEKKFLVDVYDTDFNYLTTTSYHNSLGYNLAIIKDSKMFIPNIESDSIDIKKNIGRFGIFNDPHRIDIFQVSKELTN